MDNIFSNVIDQSRQNSGNLTTTISDHLAQFARIPNMFDNISGNKSWKGLIKIWFRKFYSLVDHFSVDWEDLSKIDELNAELWMRKTNYLKVSLLGWTYTKRGISHNYKKI